METRSARTVVLLDAPLGTYHGWNITATGFHKDKLCTYAGRMAPFATTRAERIVSGDPRLSSIKYHVNSAAWSDRLTFLSSSHGLMS